MRYRTVLALGLAATLPLAASLAGADEGYRHGRLRYVEPGTSSSARPRRRPRRRSRTSRSCRATASGRTTPAGPSSSSPTAPSCASTAARKLDYAAHEEERDERIVLRLWSGSVVVHAPSQPSLRFEIETPAGFVEALERSVVRVDVDGRRHAREHLRGRGGVRGRRASLWASARRRAGANGRTSRRASTASKRTTSCSGTRSASRKTARAENSARYLPDDLDEYAGEFETNGDWRYNGEVSGYVWFPHVEVGWQPYSNGRWAWTPYGWTWVPYENWGWAPSHYGRWGYGASMGWYWIPGRTWGPAWVSWAVGGGYAGWCPLGWRDHPVTPWGTLAAPTDGGMGGRAVPRQASSAGRWTRGTSCARESWADAATSAGTASTRCASTPAVLRVADSPLLRPTRDVAALRPSDAAPRLIRTRDDAGRLRARAVRRQQDDDPRAVDARATVRRPPASRARGTGRRSGTGSSDPQESRTPTGAMPRGGASAQGDDRRAPETGGVTSSPRSAPRPAPCLRAARRERRQQRRRRATHGTPGGRRRGVAHRPGATATAPRPTGRAASTRTATAAVGAARRRRRSPPRRRLGVAAGRPGGEPQRLRPARARAPRRRRSSAAAIGRRTAPAATGRRARAAALARAARAWAAAIGPAEASGGSRPQRAAAATGPRPTAAAAHRGRLPPAVAAAVSAARRAPRVGRGRRGASVRRRRTRRRQRPCRRAVAAQPRLARRRQGEASNRARDRAKSRALDTPLGEVGVGRASDSCSVGPARRRGRYPELALDACPRSADNPADAVTVG